MIRVFRNGWKHTIGIIITIHNGSFFENEKTEGYTHVAEHLMFSGTKKYTRYDLRDLHERLFHDLEATTSREEVHIFCRIEKDNFHEAMNILSQMIFEWKCRANIFQDEKEDLIAEIQTFFSSSEYKTRKIMYSFLPYKKQEILGTIPQMKRLKYEDVKKIQAYWTAFLQNTPIDILLLGNAIGPKEKKITRDLFQANVLEKTRPKTWSLQSVEWIQKPLGSMLQIQCNIRHPYLLLLGQIYYSRWRAVHNRTANFDAAQFHDRTVFFVSKSKKLGSRKLFFQPITKIEFNAAKTEFLKHFRHMLDGIEVIESLQWLQGFRYRTYGDIPSENPNDIYALYEKLTYQDFIRFLQPILSVK